MSTLTRSWLPAALAICGALLAPALAHAHVSVQPNTIPEGAFVTLNLRVPGEQEHAYAYKVDLLLPPGLTEVDTQPLPGWSVKQVTSKLSQPIQTADGPIDEQVSRVIWTGDRSRLGRLQDGTFMQFPLSIAMPEGVAGRSLAFKAVEYYSNREVVHWIGPPDAEFPAATVNATAKGGVIEDVAGSEAGPAPGQAPTATNAQDSSTGSDGMATTALIVAIVGLLAALVAIVLVRRQRTPRDMR